MSLTGEHHVIDISSIVIPPDRQRKSADAKQDAELRDSIAQYGLINAIVVTREGELVAGFRRLSQCRAIGWTHITAQYLDEVNDELRFRIEFEENERRSDLSWQERHDALIKLHAFFKARDPQWTAARTADNTQDFNAHQVGDHLIVEKYKNNSTVRDADNFNKALREAKKLQEREAADAWKLRNDDLTLRNNSILQADFNEWAPAYIGPPFDIIHCDFPYGINSQASGANPSGYDDRPEVYWQLLETLTNQIDRVCAPQAHMIFWCSANIEIAAKTFALLRAIPDFQWDEVPLVWMKSDGKGIAPDSLRRYRRTYEIAFFGWRGDHKLIRVKDNAVAYPSDGEHPHAKPTAVLEHFFDGILTSTSRVFDPTCGGATALVAAKRGGARVVLGLEQNEEYCALARRNIDAERLRRLDDANNGK